ncbi:RDD family protein [Streptomyces sp. P6-2-1]|uniref:RDD family protein n=1 Tax=unclassified Streptomyces TaxID=2593676 RepID=UPI003D360721
MTSAPDPLPAQDPAREEEEPEPGSTRRHSWAMVIDFLFAAVAGTIATLVLTPKYYAPGEAHSTAVDWGIAAACYLGCSFVNQVLLARVLHGSLGRHVLDMHAVMKETGRPVGLPRLALRWLIGLPTLPVGLLGFFLGGFPYPMEILGITVVRRD